MLETAVDRRMSSTRPCPLPTIVCDTTATVPNFEEVPFSKTIFKWKNPSPARPSEYQNPIINLLSYDNKAPYKQTNTYRNNGKNNENSAAHSSVCDPRRQSETFVCRLQIVPFIYFRIS